MLVIARSIQEWLPSSYTQHLNWFHAFFHISIPFVGIVGVAFVPLKWNTAILAVFMYWICSLGITAGYHRLWTHRSYEASLPLRLVLAILGAGALQWSIAWWVRHHRAHHRYTDTDKDPYNAKRGFFHAHLGWLIWHTPEKWGEVDLSDLVADPVVTWQDRYYLVIAILTAFGLPAAVAHIGWGDCLGGLVYGGFVRVCAASNVTYLINSLCHAPWAGSQPYSHRHSARDIAVMGFLNNGEGYHNFHHTFPRDYRNGVHWYDLDLSKWVIWTCSQLRLASTLTRVSESEIEKARQRQVDASYTVREE
ncbi:hypothetical protein ETB97_000433 [Aspergillus alliaceus]|uniref:Fatty acid desaturase domain-containing protein n=1 Tax=Petromyces alliaceus TaxID=209559 RepID=A0A8H6E6I3_PETAA|nr:hypothetical protein ETB97_000433 [Aspergillus burnettii]